jgi:2-dehydropantoate 2-reductase
LTGSAPVPPVSAPRIAVFGAGGVGGYFGARLRQAGADVHLIARGAHLDALRRGGLQLRSPLGDATVRVPATDRPENIGPCDYVLLCVKAYDTAAAARRLGPLLGPGTAVLSLQNGVDNEGHVARLIGARHVMGGAAYIFSTIAEPGVIDHTGGPARIVFGELDGARTPRVERLLDVCRKAGIDAAIAPDIRVELWSKFAFLCAVAGMTAATRLPVGDIRDAPAAWAMLRRMVEEVCAVASAAGVILPADSVERHVDFTTSLPPGSFSSLHHDLTHGRRMELEALQGTVVRLARDHGVAAPMNEAVYALLQPWALRAERGGSDRPT